jgi:hypothetical protein
MIRIDVHHLLASLTYLPGSHKHLVLMRRQLVENGGMGQMEIQRFVELRECGRRLAAIADGLDMPAGRASAARLAGTNRGRSESESVCSAPDQPIQ